MGAADRNPVVVEAAVDRSPVAELEVDHILAAAAAVHTQAVEAAVHSLESKLSKQKNFKSFSLCKSTT